LKRPRSGLAATVRKAAGVVVDGSVGVDVQLNAIWAVGRNGWSGPLKALTVDPVKKGDLPWDAAFSLEIDRLAFSSGNALKVKPVTADDDVDIAQIVKRRGFGEGDSYPDRIVDFFAAGAQVQDYGRQK